MSSSDRAGPRRRGRVDAGWVHGVVWAAVAAVGVLGCQDPNAPDPPEPEPVLSRFIHGYPAAGTMRVHDSGEVIVPELSYGEGTDWLELGLDGQKPPFDLAFVEAATGDTVAHGGFSPYFPEFTYTVILVRTGTSTLFITYQEEYFPASQQPGTGRIMLLNAAGGRDAIDARVSVAGAWSAFRVPFDDDSHWGGLPPGTYDVAVDDPESGTTLLETTVEVQGDEARLLVLLDDPSGGVRHLLLDHPSEG